MNADKFFNTHSLEEISQKTKISPISLRFIRNKEFDKIPKVKFLGFIKIIEKTYNVDLSDLVEEYNNIKYPKEEFTPQKDKNKNSTFFITIFSFILILLGGFLLFKNLNSSKQTLPKIIENNITQKDTIITNNSTSIPQKSTKISQVTTNLKPSTIKEQNISREYKITITPNKLLWFKATNIKTNKSIQFLTSHKKILPKGDYYIKFGHGEFNLTYNNQTITPNTKKVIRILFKNGHYKFMKKPNRYEK